MRTWIDVTSGNIVVAVDEEQKLVLLRTRSNENFRELAVFSWEEARYCLEDIRDGVEHILHRKDGGIWHLGDEPLEEADIEVPEDETERLPFRRLIFVVRDYAHSEVIALTLTQVKLGEATVQAYAGKAAIDQVTLIKRGTPEVVTQDDGDEGQWGHGFFVNLSPDDVCKVRTTLDFNPAATHCWRGGARLKSLRDGSPGEKLWVLSPSSYSWRFDDAGNLIVTFTSL